MKPTPRNQQHDPAPGTPKAEIPSDETRAEGASEETPADLASDEARAEVGMLVAFLHPGSASRRARALVREALQGEGVSEDEISDAETAAGELAANAERHGRPPYEVRVFTLGGAPAWCEVVDGDPDLGWIPAVLDRPRVQTVVDLYAEGGRGLMLVRVLSEGHCRAYPTTTFATGEPAKAVAFALPTRSGTRLTCPPLLRLGRRRARVLS
ncbi:ATP-binding protein [Sphaerisporangium album]|nr:ATP-binding protein [Sphaerisporangium album]